MSELLEQQAEECEALQSIYEGDAAFKEINERTFQYKYGEEDNYKSFLVEIKWGDQYPSELPIINMDTFYNRNLIPAVKQKIHGALTEEASNWLGCAMTYTLFEFLKERIDELTAEQPENTPAGLQPIEDDSVAAISAIKISDNSEASKKKEVKKEQLTKAQKRRQWEQSDHKGDKPRGWDWVDIVKHLSQTGGKEMKEEHTTAAAHASANSIGGSAS